MKKGSVVLHDDPTYIPCWQARNKKWLRWPEAARSIKRKRWSIQRREESKLFRTDSTVPSVLADGSTLRDV
jgi:hypothetical protein